MSSPLRQLALATLQPFQRSDGYEVELAVFDRAPRRAVEALVANGVGLDLVAGERVLAGAQLITRAKGHEHRLTLAITDRLSAMAGWSTLRGPLDQSRIRMVIPHYALTSVENKKAGFIEAAHVALHAGAAAEKLAFADIQPQLAAFYQGIVAQVPPDARCEPPTPFVQRSDADPAGIDAAVAGLWVDDPEARTMLATVKASMQAGMPADVATDLVGRMVVAHRALLGAPAARGNQWISPLSPQDFRHTLTRLLGMPAAQLALVSGHQLDFQINPQRDGLDGLLTAAGVASFLALGVGFSPAAVAARALAGRQPVTFMRVVFGDFHGGTAFQLYGRGAPLEQEDSLFATRVHAALCAAAYPVLLQRAHRGWDAPYDLLMAG